MIISHWLYPVNVLGPGDRIVLWTQGCHRKCKGCVSPELQLYDGIDYPISYLLNIINGLLNNEKIQGVTISGGEPFEQADELLELCNGIMTNDILVYTGYSYSELIEVYGKNVLSVIGVLITEPFVEELNDGLPLRGSSNQQIIYLDKHLEKKYNKYLCDSEREQQLFVSDGYVYLAGIPKKGAAKLERDKIIDIITEGYDG